MVSVTALSDADKQDGVPEWLVPIIPQDNLYFFPMGAEDTNRFARLFADSWRQIPEPDRGAMRQHWQTDQLRKHVPFHPFIEFFDFKHDWFKGCGEPAIAATSWMGHNLSYCSLVFDNMPDQVGKAYIAHELAHVFLFAADPTHGDDEAFDEVKVDETLADWGFDFSALYAWLSEHGGDIDRWFREAGYDTTMTPLPDSLCHPERSTTERS